MLACIWAGGIFGNYQTPPTWQVAPGFCVSASGRHQPFFSFFSDPAGPYESAFTFALAAQSQPTLRPDTMSFVLPGFSFWKLTFPPGVVRWALDVNPLYFIVLSAIGPLATLAFRRFRQAVSLKLAATYWLGMACVMALFLPNTWEAERVVAVFAGMVAIAGLVGMGLLLVAAAGKRIGAREKAVEKR
jgi:uncharacterized membrane protein YhaH (DUF805 family)